MIFYSLLLFIISCHGQTTSPPDDAGVEQLFAILVIVGIIALICCGICCLLCIIKALCSCCKSLINSIFKCVCCPCRFLMWGCGKIFFCRGCDKEVGSRCCASFFNFLATIFMVIRLGVVSALSSTSSDLDYEQAAADGANSILSQFGIVVKKTYVQAAIIVIFIILCFSIKAFKYWKARKQAKENPSQNIEAQKVKNVQTLIITFSDTVFKVLSAAAIVIGSSYSGTEECEDDDPDCTGKSLAYFYIYLAGILGFSEEILDMADQYLTMAIFFKKIKEDAPNVSTDAGIAGRDRTFTFQFNPQGNFMDMLEDKVEDKVESTVSVEKTILWNAAWGTIKLLILLGEQGLALAAAIVLFFGDQDEKLYFIIIVVFCCVVIIVVSLWMCCKFQRLSCGLCCKYYCCCFYNCCSDHCDKSWIKIDPIENENAELNHLGQVIIINVPKGSSIGQAVAMVQQQPINPSLYIQSQPVQQTSVNPQIVQVIQQPVPMQQQQQQYIQQPQVAQSQHNQPQMVQMVQQQLVYQQPINPNNTQVVQQQQQQQVSPQQQMVAVNSGSVQSDDGVAQQVSPQQQMVVVNQSSGSVQRINSGSVQSGDDVAAQSYVSDQQQNLTGNQIDYPGSNASNDDYVQ